MQGIKNSPVLTELNTLKNKTVHTEHILTSQ